MTQQLHIGTTSSIDELVGNLRQLDIPTLKQLIHSLQKVQLEKEQQQQSEQRFWQFIDHIDWSKTTEEEQLQPLIDTLAESEVDMINDFSEQLAYHLSQLDGPQFYTILKTRPNGVSADTFLYARCLVVAKGKGFYKDVLQHPEKIIQNTDLEGLLYVAEMAYEQQTGETYDYIPSVIYESFFNQELWKEKAIVL